MSENQYSNEDIADLADRKDDQEALRDLWEGDLPDCVKAEDVPYETRMYQGDGLDAFDDDTVVNIPTDEDGDVAFDELDSLNEMGETVSSVDDYPRSRSNQSNDE